MCTLPLKTPIILKTFYISHIHIQYKNIILKLKKISIMPRENFYDFDDVWYVYQFGIKFFFNYLIEAIKTYN